LSTVKRKAVAGAPVYGETVTLFQALALIAFGDETLPLDLRLPGAVAALVDPTTGLALPGREAEVKHKMAAWIDARSGMHRRLAEAATRLAVVIGDGTVPARGEREVDSADQSNATEFHNPIPVTDVDLQNSVCEINFDQGSGPSHGGHVLFRKGTLASGAPAWVRYGAVHVSKRAIEHLFASKPTPPGKVRPPQATVLISMLRAAEKCLRTTGEKITQAEARLSVTEEIKATTPHGSPPIEASDDQLRAAWGDRTMASHRRGRGEKKKRSTTGASTPGPI
jgi:hypothetical protein